MGNQEENLSEQLQESIPEIGENIGAAMGFFRTIMDKALWEGDETTAIVAELLYEKAAEIQHQRNRIEIKKITDSDEVQALIKVLNEANDKLVERIKEEKELAEDLGEMLVVLKKLEEGFVKLL